MSIKKIYNPKSRKLYQIRQKNASTGENGRIIGVHDAAKEAEKQFRRVIRELSKK